MPRGGQLILDVMLAQRLDQCALARCVGRAPMLYAHIYVCVYVCVCVCGCVYVCVRV